MCVSSASTGLCGEPRATAVPTATSQLVPGVRATRTKLSLLSGPQRESGSIRRRRSRLLRRLTPGPRALPTRLSAEIIGETGTITLPVPFTSWNSEATVFVIKNGQMTEQHFPVVDQYRLEVEHFANCIRSGQEPAFRLSETLENMATIEAIYQAAGYQ